MAIALKTIGKLNGRSILYDCVKYYENELNDIDNAIKYYELSNTNCNFEVTRILFDSNELNKLKYYCFNGILPKSNKKDKLDKTDNVHKKDKNEEKRRLNNLKQNRAQYCESLGDYQSSLQAYEQAKDYYNLVRLLCLMGNLEDSKKVVNSNEHKNLLENKSFELEDTSDLKQFNRSTKSQQEIERQSGNAAMLHFGKHLESIDPSESVQNYLNCSAINHAIRACKLNQFDEQLTKIIQSYGSKNGIIELLKRLDENEDNFENLFNLYLKIDMIDKCLKIAFQGRLWS